MFRNLATVIDLATKLLSFGMIILSLKQQELGRNRHDLMAMAIKSYPNH